MKAYQCQNCGMIDKRAYYAQCYECGMKVKVIEFSAERFDVKRQAHLKPITDDEILDIAAGQLAINVDEEVPQL